MKPKDLKPTFSYADRHVRVDDGILYVPDYYDRYDEWTFPGWAELLGNDNPVVVEYCSGHGHWICKRALNNPYLNYVAVDIRFDRVQRIWAKRFNEAIGNLFIVNGDGRVVTREYFPALSISEIYINFPDPWPKKKHEKNRLITQTFLDELWRVSKEGATLTLATDDQTYADSFVVEVDTHAKFSHAFTKHDWPGYGASEFESIWRREGKIIHYMQYCRK